jgi:hypothetical protein
MNFDFLKRFKARMNMELAAISINQLTALANRATALGLISAHGYRQGQYEILRQGEFILLDPKEAIGYLQSLIDELEQQ